MALLNFIFRKILKAVKSADKTASGSRITEPRLFVYNLHFLSVLISSKKFTKGRRTYEANFTVLASRNYACLILSFRLEM
jgi:hypothetical protein